MFGKISGYKKKILYRCTLKLHKTFLRNPYKNDSKTICYFITYVRTLSLLHKLKTYLKSSTSVNKMTTGYIILKNFTSFINLFLDFQISIHCHNYYYIVTRDIVVLTIDCPSILLFRLGRYKTRNLARLTSVYTLITICLSL